ncbi:hypothetical protein Hypma_005633 [Hypsizygus marmoreus]|uniref:Uncharacterized protein n=1 Tax=Hypsizygus marmoreus TaxID=39966 RepID=A0A369JYY1_HYPMA|nr:hypothetical protein Hypma_005633 [Hypsizygus marmoreus]
MGGQGARERLSRYTANLLAELVSAYDQGQPLLTRTHSHPSELAHVWTSPKARNTVVSKKHEIPVLREAFRIRRLHGWSLGSRWELSFFLRV